MKLGKARYLALFACLAFVLSAAPGSSPAADYEAGLQAYKEGRFQAAYENWQPLAEAGDPEAEFALGQLFYWGRGVEQDKEAAASWFRRAGAQGHGRALYTLGFMALSGEAQGGTDYEAAAEWWRKAAATGNPLAMVSLGTAYESGNGVSQDLVEAYKWNTLGVRHNGGQPPMAAGQNLERLAEQMTPAQIQEAEARAKRWKP